MKMKLWLISQTVNSGYDTYDNAVVASLTPAGAKKINPGGNQRWVKGGWQHECGYRSSYNSDWATPDQVTAMCIGEAKEGTKEGVILASFNAG